MSTKAKSNLYSPSNTLTRRPQPRSQSSKRDGTRRETIPVNHLTSKGDQVLHRVLFRIPHTIRGARDQKTYHPALGILSSVQYILRSHSGESQSETRRNMEALTFAILLALRVSGKRTQARATQPTACAPTHVSHSEHTHNNLRMTYSLILLRALLSIKNMDARLWIRIVNRR